MAYAQAADARSIKLLLVPGGLWILWRISRRVLQIFSSPGALPPGPKRRLFVGNVLEIPREYPWKKWAEWGKTYGDVTYLENFGSPMVVINSYKAASEMTDKRPVYSDRPHFTLLMDILGWDWNISLMPWGGDTSKHRALLHQTFGPGPTKQHYSMQMQEAYHVLGLVLKDPDNFRSHLSRWAGGTALKSSFGYTASDINDAYITLGNEALHKTNEAVVPGRYLVDLIPWLKYIPGWLPGGRFKHELKETYRKVRELYDEPYANAKKDNDAGRAPPSMMSTLLERYTDDDGNIQDEVVIKNCVGMAFAAGYDTTLGAALAFVLAMVLNPKVQARAHEELDRVVGQERLPTIEDRSALPYVNAIIKETLRWHPSVPAGIPRKSMEDDYYNGYFIPAGTVVITNQWAMLYDENEYPDPEVFCPERFLPVNGGGMPLDPRKVAFGFGRRDCPGRYFAENSLFLFAASMLAVFDFKKKRDANGKIIDPVCHFPSLGISHPDPFECQISPRSKTTLPLIRAANKQT